MKYSENRNSLPARTDIGAARTLAQTEARQRIAFGEDPNGLCHAIDDNPARGLSSAISAEEYQRGGYIAYYLTLKEWAQE